MDKPPVHRCVRRPPHDIALVLPLPPQLPLLPLQVAGSLSMAWWWRLMAYNAVARVTAPSAVRRRGEATSVAVAASEACDGRQGRQ